MTSRIPDPSSPLEDEGIPDLEGGLPEKRITGDEQEGIIPPGDEPVAVDDFGTTAAEQREGESLDLRVTREEPETSYPSSESEPEVGRLVAPDEGAHGDEEKDEIARDAGADGGGYSAEERAMHVEPEA